MSKLFVLGNGESRQSVNLDVLSFHGKVYGCNALYRDWTPDALICVDGGMMHEVYTSGYALKNKCYFRSWSKLPEEMFDMIVEGTSFDQEGFTISNDKQTQRQFVLNGTDPNQMQRLYDHHIKNGSDKKTIDELLSKHHRWITWVEDEDQVNIISDDYGGWSAGPIAVRMGIEDESPTDVFLIGFDLTSSDNLVNNVYKDTDNYLSGSAAVTPCSNWIVQHINNFKDFPDVTFWKVNPNTIGADKISSVVEEWKDFGNVKYMDFKELQNVLDKSVLY